MPDFDPSRRKTLRVLAADEDEHGLRLTADALQALGHDVISSATNLAEVTEAIAREDPDLSVVLVHDDDDHALDLIEEITSFSRGPVVAALLESRPDFVARAAERGIVAYARNLGATELHDAIDVALALHEERSRLAVKVEQLESALDRRALIERAKGIVMERHGVSEREAFDLIRTRARSTNRSVVAIADSVCAGHPLLKGAATAGDEDAGGGE